MDEDLLAYQQGWLPAERAERLTQQLLRDRNLQRDFAVWARQQLLIADVCRSLDDQGSSGGSQFTVVDEREPLASTQRRRRKVRSVYNSTAFKADARHLGTSTRRRQFRRQQRLHRLSIIILSLAILAALIVPALQSTDPGQPRLQGPETGIAGIAVGERWPIDQELTLTRAVTIDHEPGGRLQLTADSICRYQGQDADSDTTHWTLTRGSCQVSWDLEAPLHLRTPAGQITLTEATAGIGLSEQELQVTLGSGTATIVRPDGHRHELGSGQTLHLPIP